MMLEDVLTASRSDVGLVPALLPQRAREIDELCRRPVRGCAQLVTRDDLVWIMRQGEPHNYDLFLEPVKDSTGKIVGVTSVITELTP